MVVRRATDDIEHFTIRDLPGILAPPDCLVRNKTRVLPARFTVRRQTGARMGALFVAELAAGRWIVLIAGAGRIKPGERLGLEGGPWTMQLCHHGARGQCEMHVEPPDAAAVVLEQVGRAPLPPYISRSKEESIDAIRRDMADYQTVFADVPGSIAAPTAGLHFTPELLDRLRGGGVSLADVVLHVGLGTFAPIEADNLSDHLMHSEWYDLSAETIAKIEACRAKNGRVIAVGTTSVRVLESCAAHGSLQPQTGWTNLLIQPPYQFQAVDALLTNFHLPETTLLALVCAFAGTELTLRAYRVAVAERYRFFSFGDAMLIV